MPKNFAIKLCDAYRKERRGWHASSRIRGHWLAKYWDELDDIFYPEYFGQEYNEFFDKNNQLKLLENYEAVIIHKAYEYELIRAIHGRGQKVVIDLSDPDYLLGFSNVARAGQCLLSLAHSDAVVANSQKIIDDLKEGYDKPMFLIPDRIDLGGLSQREIREVVWFGHSDNFESIVPLVPKITKLYKLKVISDKPVDGAEFVPYDPATMYQEIKKSDAVILGAILNPYKSPNRYLTALALNMPVVTMESLDMDIKESVKQWRQVMTAI